MLRRLNERSLFAVLLAEGRLTRVALQHRTGLSLPTITRALANLQDAGLVADVGTVSTGRGPAAAVYEVRPRDGGVAAAIALTGDMISVSLMSTAGESLACEQEKPRRSASGPALVQTVRRLLRTALRSARIDRIHVSHTVVAVPAVVDSERPAHDRDPVRTSVTRAAPYRRDPRPGRPIERRRQRRQPRGDR